MAKLQKGAMVRVAFCAQSHGESGESNKERAS